MSLWQQLLEEPQVEGHLVQLHDGNEQLLTANAVRYFHEGLKRGDGIVAIATPERREAFAQHLTAAGADPEKAVRMGMLLFLDTEETLAQFMVDGQPHWGLFESTVGATIREVRADSTGLRVFGDMAGLLWKASQFSAAIRLEQLWNKLLRSIGFHLFCAYPIDIFGKEFQMTTVDALLCAHTHLLPTGRDADLERCISRAMDETLGPKAEGLKVLIKANYRPAWAALPRSEAVILWLRNNLPNYADEILERARQHYQESQAGDSRALENTGAG
ncbi:MAG: MEDS domain-containing protein [Bryobacteraceae bacterium]